MRSEYDFSNGERGKFFHSDAELHLPIYLDVDVERYLAKIATEKRIPLGDLVNGLLERDIEIIESLK